MTLRQRRAVAFPNPRNAPPDQPVAWGGELGVDWLLAAYENGIFPWYSKGQPILWWSPDPRFLLYPNSARISPSLEREANRPRWKVTADSAFPEVIEACAEVPRKGQEGTWITVEMIDAYIALHEAGYAHSVECWLDDNLAGGLYGVSLGAGFFGESMFFRKSNASKVAFYYLIRALAGWRFTFIDCQVPTGHLGSLGATAVPRNHFLDLLRKTLEIPTRRGNWMLEH